MLLNCCFAAPLPYSGASFALLGASWAPLGRLLGSTWRLLEPTWRLLGLTWSNLQPLGRILGPTCRLLGLFWAPPGPTWPPSGLQVASKWPPNGLQVATKRHFNAPQALPSGLQVSFNLHTYLTFELSLASTWLFKLSSTPALVALSALPCQLNLQSRSVLTKLHLNFQSSCQFLLYFCIYELHVAV